MSWQVTPLAGSLGAEITGPNLSNPSEADIAEVQALLLAHKVLFFPKQKVSVDEHVYLGKQFGRIESHPNLKKPVHRSPGYI